MVQDIPSLRAEFGHPDVSIALTCLSYYQEGLTAPQLQQCFEVLLKLDNPELEYEQWTGRSGHIPKELRQLSGINTEDPQQFELDVFPMLHAVKAVVDFYLAQVVFPKAAKDFPFKLSTSGWDLAEKRNHVTTGFSGTNDNRYLLPTSIEQSDPTQQRSTNALVLSYLLQEENNHYRCNSGAITNNSSVSDSLLQDIIQQKPEIRVLLDVGAQILDLKNKELASHWLQLRPDVAAAVYFTENDELAVISQDGTVEPLRSSPYKQRLDECIVYLDDAHTRGTDLKLPRTTRAAVTLGPKVTKDRLIQGLCFVTL